MASKTLRRKPRSTKPLPYAVKATGSGRGRSTAPEKGARRTNRTHGGMRAATAHDDLINHAVSGMQLAVSRLLVAAKALDDVDGAAISPVVPDYESLAFRDQTVSGVTALLDQGQRALDDVRQKLGMLEAVTYFPFGSGNGEGGAS